MAVLEEANGLTQEPLVDLGLDISDNGIASPRHDHQLAEGRKTPQHVEAGNGKGQRPQFPETAAFARRAENHHAIDDWAQQTDGNAGCRSTDSHQHQGEGIGYRMLSAMIEKKPPNHRQRTQELLGLHKGLRHALRVRAGRVGSSGKLLECASAGPR